LARLCGVLIGEPSWGEPMSDTALVSSSMATDFMMPGAALLPRRVAELAASQNLLAQMPGAAFFPDAELREPVATGATDRLQGRGQGRSAAGAGMSCTLPSRGCNRLFGDAKLGVKTGDRVAAMMPNMPETIACMLAAASLGAVWSSCSPDFGEQGVLDRFGQIEPVLFIVPDGYWYNGKPSTSRPRSPLSRRNCRRCARCWWSTISANQAR
jgi:hypothetical protein